MNAWKNSQEEVLWPHNLLFEVSTDKTRVQGPITKDQMRGLGFLLSILPKRECSIIIKRYKEYKTIGNIADDTKKPALWVKRTLDRSLAKLRRPECQIFYNRGYSVAIGVLKLDAESAKLATREAELAARETKLLANEAALDSLERFIAKAKEVRDSTSSLRSREDELWVAMDEVARALEIAEASESEDTKELLRGLKMAQYSSVSIRELGLSNRCFYALYRGGIRTISELGKLSKQDLLSFRNLGKVSVQEIADAFRTYTGFALPEY